MGELGDGLDLAQEALRPDGRLFQKTFEDAAECKGTAIIFVPAPCISGWKYEDGRTIELAIMGAKVGVYPTVVRKRGEGARSA